MRDLRESTIGGYQSIEEGNTGTRDTGGRVLSNRVETEGGEGVPTGTSVGSVESPSSPWARPGKCW